MDEILRLREHPELTEAAADWFSAKWRIPRKAYLESILDGQTTENPIPRWYVMLHEGKFIAGLGVIKNDFHLRPDLTPNICAVFTEPEYRRQGIAGKMLNFVCDEFKQAGIDTMYLITDHDSFYERYGWDFLCMVEEESGGMTRMYVHKQ